MTFVGRGNSKYYTTIGQMNGGKRGADEKYFPIRFLTPGSQSRDWVVDR